MKDKNQHQITTLLFDYGGVLAEEGFRDGLTKIARQQGLDPATLPRQAMDAVYDSGYVVGRGRESDFWQLLKQRTGLTGDPALLRREILERFRLRSWMLEWVDRLRRHGYRVGILSDQTDWLDELEERDHFFHHFDRVFNSYHLGMGKRNPRTFRTVACRMGARPGEVLFIDDSLSNVERARAAGLRALRFEGREPLERELAALLE